LLTAILHTEKAKTVKTSLVEAEQKPVLQNTTGQTIHTNEKITVTYHNN
jgi:hypothetical protein